MLQRTFIFLLTAYVRTGIHFFFRRFQFSQSNSSVNEGPVIFAANHQNAFMDALAIVMSQPRTSYFLTQAGVFKTKLGRAFFTYIYMLPIYRERDGLHTVKKNQEIFGKCVDVLVKGEQPLTIFPEGNHHLRRAIRPLKKGIARIAFSVLDKNPELNLKITPVGINYSAHRKFRSDLYIVYGEPIEVKQYYADYLKNNNQGYIKLLAEIENRMRELIIDIPRGLQYRPVAKKWVDNAWGTFDLQANFKNNQKLLKAILAEEPLPKRQVSDTPQFLKVIFYPFKMLMFINNFLAFKMVKTLTKKLLSDPAFESSMGLMFGIFLSVFIYFIQALVLLVFTDINIAVAYFLSVPILNYILFKIYRNSFVIT